MGCTVEDMTDDNTLADSDQDRLLITFDNIAETGEAALADAEAGEMSTRDVARMVGYLENQIDTLHGVLRDKDDEVAEWILEGLEICPEVSERQVAEVAADLDGGPYEEVDLRGPMKDAGIPREEMCHLMQEAERMYDLVEPEEVA